MTRQELAEALGWALQLGDHELVEALSAALIRAALNEKHEREKG